MKMVGLAVAVAMVLIATACGTQSDPAPDETRATSTTTLQRVTSTRGATPETMTLSSPAFDEQGDIPQDYTCDGADVSPPLHLEGLPAGTGSLVVTMDDPDAPGGTWDHWVAYDIEAVPDLPRAVAAPGTDGLNSWGEIGYRGPCPPSGTHHYIFEVFALDSELGLASRLTKQEVMAAIDGHVLASARLVGRYSG